MEMEMEIEKLAIFFKGLPVNFGEIAKNCAIVCSSLKSESINIPPPPPGVLYEQFFVREKFYVRCLSSFDQNTAKSPCQSPFKVFPLSKTNLLSSNKNSSLINRKKTFFTVFTFLAAANCRIFFICLELTGASRLPARLSTSTDGPTTYSEDFELLPAKFNEYYEEVLCATD